MTKPVATVSQIVINVTDYQAMKRFWGGFLGTEVAWGVDPFFCAFAPQQPGGVSVALQAVDNPTEGTRRLHIDTVADDVAAAKQQVTDLGGSHMEDVEMEGFAWSVMRDPEGNEFCIAGTGAH